MHHQGRLGACLARAGRGERRRRRRAGGLARRLRGARGAELGRPCFAEQFVEGREFNLSRAGRRRRAGSAPLGRDRLLRLPARQTPHRGPPGEMGGRLVRVPPYAAAVRFPARRRTAAGPLAATWPRPAGGCSACGATPGSISASTGRAGRGSWRSTPIRACRPTPVSPPPRAAAGLDFDQMIQRILDRRSCPPLPAR